LTRDPSEGLADKGDGGRMGACAPGRGVEENREEPRAEELVFGKVAKGGIVEVVIKDGMIDVRVEEAQAPRLSTKRPPLLTAD